ncbi:hypothetical protein FGO68_gene7363 [Halteria grandinella]|uniref:Poly [ADP-ribose] polymerase n=1 Tax=Halteria grandinella TaxID=5974 RepID=A0A8J8NS35_HALGN|nr:hypothetical protein FGO68_gene7363 [Halteria grandinella]
MQGRGLSLFQQPFAAASFVPEIVEIAKIYNPIVYSKFEGECQRMIEKNMSSADPVFRPLKSNEMFRFLFHGTLNTDPQLIYNSEDGLDLRFARDGLMGRGIYFAEDSAYSHDYSHYIQDLNLHQMFFAVVNIGRYKPYPHPDQTLKMPPLLEGSKTRRYDSCYSQGPKHFIIYDNSKQYPGYLITYRNPLEQ